MKLDAGNTAGTTEQVEKANTVVPPALFRRGFLGLQTQGGTSLELNAAVSE